MWDWLKRLVDRSSDPVYGCDLYREIGCSHVDGYLCDFPKCSMLKGYKEGKRSAQ